VSNAIDIIDFHNHFVGSAFAVGPRAGGAVGSMLTQTDALLASLDSGEVAARVVSTPLEFLEDERGNVPAGCVPRINDAMAELVHRHPGRLYGMATVDAYSGEAGARELTRAVRELGLRGVFVESAKGDLLPDAPEARPTLAAAAELGVPVFLHPVEDPELFRRFKRYGRLGVRLTRGTVNSAALFALLESGVLDTEPKLNVVVTALALGGVLLAAGAGDGARLRADTPPASRRHIYVDTTGLHPASVRAAVDVVGADHVLAGTDWPVVIDGAPRIREVLVASGLGADDQRKVAGGNTLRLLRA
jgi:aminocarboxymuconate-semialdehyde decarboxylase